MSFEKSRGGEAGALSMSPERARLLADRRPPFLIRGHHISVFAYLLLNHDGNPPELPGERARANAKFFRDEQKKAKRAGESERIAYWADVIGNRSDQRWRRKIAEQWTLAKFYYNPDDYPVKVCAVQDAICRTCIIGDHCTTSTDQYGPKGASRTERDTKLVQQFVTWATELGFEDQVIVTEEMTDYKDKEPERVPAALTTTGIFKAVIEESFSLFGYGSFHPHPEA